MEGNNTTIMYLAKDIHSHVRPSMIYGRKGDQVKVISNWKGVAVVEDADGKRFSVITDELTDSHIQPDPEFLPAESKTIINRVPPKKSKPAKVAPINSQPTLL